MAKAAASLATMSGGRVELGVGSGATSRGVAAMGGVPRAGDDAVTFTDEAIQIMRRASRGETIHADTRQHRVAGYEAGPIPPQPIQVWLGSQGPKMLAVTGRVERRLDVPAEYLRSACCCARAAGRDRRRGTSRGA